MIAVLFSAAAALVLLLAGGLIVDRLVSLRLLDDRPEETADDLAWHAFDLAVMAEQRERAETNLRTAGRKL